MMTLAQAGRLIGAHVHYLDETEGEECGLIARVNSRYVFVIYEGGQTAKATNPRDLTVKIDADSEYSVKLESE